MITLDGSIGEGGGQILRSALALSMVTGQPFRIENIRAGRAKPGLMRQHLTAVNAAAEISRASVEGAAIGSQSLAFYPVKITPGEYNFSIGSAGSTTLVLQTVLPALLTADSPSTITLEGGTHNPFAPPIEFLDRAFLPLINRMGANVKVSLLRAGFFPAGGGRVFVQIDPVKKLTPIHIPERGQIVNRVARSYVAALSGAIAKKELSQVERRLNWSGNQLKIIQLPDDQGPGNLLTLEIESEHITEVFTGFGSKNVSSEQVADEAIQQARSYLTDGVPVGHYLADQLLLPMALAGSGSFLTQHPSKHTTTNAQVIEQFLPIKVGIQLDDKKLCRVNIG